MTETERKALALVNEVMAERGWTHYEVPRQACSRIEALCRAIEQHEAFRQEVSDAIVFALKVYGGQRFGLDPLRRFIIPKPVDPLVEVMNDIYGGQYDEDDANDLRAAIEKRGGKIVWGEG